MRAEPCREWRERLGAYVLGQLPEQELRATRAHLEGCAACGGEVEALAPLARLLPKADPSRLTGAPRAPAGLADRVAARVAGEARSRRRRRRTRLGFALAGGGAAAALLVGVTLTDDAVRTPREPAAGVREVSFDSLPPGVEIAASLRPRPFGTEITMHVDGVHSGTLCRVFLRSMSGAAMPAGSFRYRYSGGGAMLTSALDLSATRAVGVRAYGRTFVAPLRGAATAPRPTITERTS
jgi:Putative zinc-finger